MASTLTFDVLSANKDKLSETFREYIKKLYNRASYKPEYDNAFICEPSKVDTNIAAIVKVSIIETILKPMTFIMYWRVHTNGYIEHFDGDPTRVHGPNAYARQMYMPYTQAIQEWVEAIKRG